MSDYWTAADHIFHEKGPGSLCRKDGTLGPVLVVTDHPFFMAQPELNWVGTPALGGIVEGANAQDQPWFAEASRHTVGAE